MTSSSRSPMVISRPTLEEPTHEMVNGGVTYRCVYMGCVEVVNSMRDMKFEERSQIARQCIKKIVIKTDEQKNVKNKWNKNNKEAHSPASSVERHLGQVDLTAGSSVCRMTVSTDVIKVVNSAGVCLAYHNMPNISFASAGEAELNDYMAYVAKGSIDSTPTRIERYCFVFFCDNPTSDLIIKAIGVAFDARFKSVQQKSPSDASSATTSTISSSCTSTLSTPIKINPQVLENLMSVKCEGRPKRRGSPKAKHERSSPTQAEYCNQLPEMNQTSRHLPQTPAMVQGAKSMNLMEMEKLEISNNNTQDDYDSPRLSHQELAKYTWYYHDLARRGAEQLLVNEGDFLVRHRSSLEAGGAPQYVLSAMADGSPKHLLLVDNEGIVRTSDRVFASVQDFVEHHSTTGNPIESPDTKIYLINPVSGPPGEAS